MWWIKVFLKGKLFRGEKNLFLFIYVSYNLWAYSCLHLLNLLFVKQMLYIVTLAAAAVSQVISDL